MFEDLDLTNGAASVLDVKNMDSGTYGVGVLRLVGR